MSIQNRQRRMPLAVRPANRLRALQAGPGSTSGAGIPPPRHSHARLTGPGAGAEDDRAAGVQASLAIRVTQEQHNPVAGRPSNTVPTRTKRHLPVRSGTAANMEMSCPIRSLPSSGKLSVLDPGRRHITTGLLVSGRSAVRIRSPAPRIRGYQLSHLHKRRKRDDHDDAVRVRAGQDPHRIPTTVRP